MNILLHELVIALGISTAIYNLVKLDPKNEWEDYRIFVSAISLSVAVIFSIELWK